MKKRNLKVIVTWLVAAVLLAAGCSSGNQISLKITSKVSDRHVSGRLMSCTHYVAIYDDDGTEVVSRTEIPDNEVLELALPRIGGQYTARFYYQRVMDDGPEPLKTLELDHEFSGKKKYKLKFTAPFTGHGVEY